MKQKVCKFDELVSGKARRFEIGNRAIAVVRIDDKVYAIGDKCSHADVALSDGEVLCDTKEIECIRTPVRSVLKLANQTPCLQRNQCPYMSLRLITAKYLSS